jgi:hypothetical protein
MYILTLSSVWDSLHFRRHSLQLLIEIFAMSDLIIKYLSLGKDSMVCDRRPFTECVRPPSAEQMLLLSLT